MFFSPTFLMTTEFIERCWSLNDMVRWNLRGQCGSEVYTQLYGSGMVNVETVGVPLMLPVVYVGSLSGTIAVVAYNLGEEGTCNRKQIHYLIPKLTPQHCNLDSRCRGCTSY